MDHHPWGIYAKQMFHHGYGHPLWVPDPAPGMPSAAIGDVGWLSEGEFHPLFNAMKQPGELQDQPRRAVPLDYVPFPKDTAWIKGPRMTITQPMLGGRSLRCANVAAGASAAGGSIDSSARVNLQFTCTDDYGAALILTPPAMSQTILNRALIGRYMHAHFDRWLEFANSRFEIGLKDEELVFVCETTKTSRWGVAAFHGDYRAKDGSIAANIGSIASVEFAIHVEDAKLPCTYFKTGPPKYHSSTYSSVTATSDETRPSAEDTELPDQCIFMHYFKMKRRIFFPSFPMQAAAGPQDPSVDRSRRREPVYVACADASVVDEADDFAEGREGYSETYDPVTILLEYILEHSTARFALASDLDVYDLFQGTGVPQDISSALVRLAPGISVDEAGVGVIVLGCENTSTDIDAEALPTSSPASNASIAPPRTPSPLPPMPSPIIPAVSSKVGHGISDNALRNALRSRLRRRNDDLPPNRARDVQRAFRARRAARVEALENRVTELEEEDKALRAAFNLRSSNPPALGEGSASKDIHMDDSEAESTTAVSVTTSLGSTMASRTSYPFMRHAEPSLLSGSASGESMWPDPTRPVLSPRRHIYPEQIRDVELGQWNPSSRFGLPALSPHNITTPKSIPRIGEGISTSWSSEGRRTAAVEALDEELDGVEYEVPR